MLPPMFGMGGSEILVILVVALLFLGPEKLPEAASKISKGIRDLRKQTRELTQTIENDTEIGGAIRDLKSALRGDEPRAKIQPRPAKKEPPKVDAPAADPALAAPEVVAPVVVEPAVVAAVATITLPETVGEVEPASEGDGDDGDDDLAAMIRPPAGIVAKGKPGTTPDDEPKAH
jgi:sec-independent protein translocase protein TatB